MSGNGSSKARWTGSLQLRLARCYRALGDDSLVLTDDTTAADVPGWDSLAHVNLMFGIEQASGVQFVGNQFGEFTNVGELRRFLEHRAQP